MKHLFFIHSQVTFIVSVKVIHYLNIDYKDCIFIVDREKTEHFSLSEVKVLAYPFNTGTVNFFPVFIKFWKGWRNIRKLDEFLKNATGGEEFAFYTPQTYQVYIALILSNRKCKEFNIIEEGLGSYLSDEELSRIYRPHAHSLYKRVFWKLNFHKRLKINRSFIDNGYNRAFGLTNYSFPGRNRTIVLGLPKLEDYRSNKEEEVVYGNILVYDGLVEGQIIDSGTLIVTTLVLLDFLRSKGENKLYVKYHPDQIRLVKTVILLREVLKQQRDIEVIEITPDVSLEEVAVKQNATFFVFISSVGFYASLYGRKVYSLAKVIERFNPSFSTKIESIPPIYKDNITFI